MRSKLYLGLPYGLPSFSHIAHRHAHMTAADFNALMDGLPLANAAFQQTTDYGDNDYRYTDQSDIALAFVRPRYNFSHGS